MCICKWIYIFVYIHLHIFIYIYIYVCIYISISYSPFIIGRLWTNIQRKSNHRNLELGKTNVLFTHAIWEPEIQQVKEPSQDQAASGWQSQHQKPFSEQTVQCSLHLWAPDFIFPVVINWLTVEHDFKNSVY